MQNKKYDHYTDDFISEYVKALREGNGAIFAGAGLSVAAGYFDWKKLLAPVARKLQLDINEEHDLVALAQFFVDNRGGVRDQLTKILTAEYNKAGIILTENHRILARLPIPIYWTTNYDNLIETALKDQGKLPDIKINHANLTVNIPRRDAIVYKMHGDITDLAGTVLTKHEYEDYNLYRELFSNAFKADFVARTMLFIGFSFTDPNLDYLISRIRSIQQRNTKTDYYFLKKEKSKKAYNRQVIRAKSLERYGLYAVWIKDYSNITDILLEIERRYLRSSVFISGSAVDYGRLFGPDDGSEFIQSLSKAISKEHYKIITGFGIGVGTYVINGVLQAMKELRNKRLDEYISLRPFPLVEQNSKQAGEIKTSYRKSVINDAGILVIVFGNKKENGKIIQAQGVWEEYRIAMDLGLKIVPIPLTGFVAEETYKIIMAEFKQFYPEYPKLKTMFKKLGQLEKPNETIPLVLKIIQTLNDI